MTRATKEQLNYAISALMMFAGAALSSRSLTPSFVKMVREKCLVLLEKLERDEPSVVSKELRRIIAEVNATLAKDSSQVPYPSFIETPVENQVKSHILAFELFLNHHLIGKSLTLEQEEPLFAKTVVLWNGVGTRATPKQTMAQLCSLIHTANGYLPQKEHFPVPDDTQYP